MKKFGEKFFLVEKGIGGLLLLMMLFFVFFATVGRYTRWYNMAWSDEASRYCMIWSVFLAAGLSAYRGEMFSIDLLSEKLPLKWQRVFVIARTCMMFGFTIFAMIYGTNLTLHQAKIHQTSPSLKLPMWFMYSCVPLGCALLLAHYIALAVQQLNTIKLKLDTQGGGKN